MPVAAMTSQHTNESGFALILTVFVVALATLLVMSFADQTFAYQRSVRNYTERIQADFVLKSALNLGKVLLELPKVDGVNEDWLGEPWALIAGAPALPIEGLNGEVRLAIVDEGGKINVNAIASDSSSSFGFPYPAQVSQQQTAQTPGAIDPASFWKSALRELFVSAGFVREQYERNETRTLGNTAFGPEEQVAAIHDWIDSDSNSHSSANFPGQGIESSADKAWFYNRVFRTISELALVPGMTPERMSRIAPFVRTSQPQSSKVNINTAPLEVLLAIGIPESQAREIFAERTNLPIDSAMLQNITAGDAQLARVAAVTSQEFSAFALIKMANVTRWARASINVQGSTTSRRAFINGIEIM